MPNKTFKADQIIRILWEADTGQTAEKICRNLEISRYTFYRGRRIYADLDVDERLPCPRPWRSVGRVNATRVLG